MQKFLEVKSSTKAELRTDWYHKCIRDRVPYVTVTVRSRFADVHFDYITLPTAVDDVLMGERQAEIQNALTEIFERFANAKSHFRLSSTVVSFNDLEAGVARAAAEEVYDLIYSYVRPVIYPAPA